MSINWNGPSRGSVRATTGGGESSVAASPRLGGGNLQGAVEVNHSDGPWVRPDDYQKINGVLRYSRGDNRNGFSLTELQRRRRQSPQRHNAIGEDLPGAVNASVQAPFTAARSTIGVIGGTLPILYLRWAVLPVCCAVPPTCSTLAFKLRDA